MNDGFYNELISDFNLFSHKCSLSYDNKIYLEHYLNLIEGKIGLRFSVYNFRIENEPFFRVPLVKVIIK